MEKTKKGAASVAKEQAKAPKKRRSRKKETDQEIQERMEQDLNRTLEKHREEVAKAAAEHDALKEAGEKPEQKTETEQKPEQEKESGSEPEQEQAAETVNDIALDWLPDPGIAEKPMERLKDPTEGQDLNVDSEMTLASFCDKTMSLMSAASSAIRTMKNKFGSYEVKIGQMKERILCQTAFEKALGFHYASYSKWITNRTKKCYKCGKHPSLQRMKDGSGWMVICDECWTRSETALGPMAAIKAWNEDKEDRISLMLNQPLVRKDS